MPIQWLRLQRLQDSRWCICIAVCVRQTNVGEEIVGFSLSSVIFLWLQEVTVPVSHSLVCQTSVGEWGNREVQVYTVLVQRSLMCLHHRLAEFHSLYSPFQDPSCLSYLKSLISSIPRQTYASPVLLSPWVVSHISSSCSTLILSDIPVPTPACFGLLFAWFILFHTFAFNLFISLNL